MPLALVGAGHADDAAVHVGVRAELLDQAHHDRDAVAAADEVDRLDDDEQQESWRPFAAAMVKLRWALECQLQQDAGLSFIEYHALARLSENPGHTRRMSELAEVTNASLSRLSHLIKRLELRDLASERILQRVARPPSKEQGVCSEEGSARC